MNKKNDEYIQLPPLHRDTEGIAVRAIWEFTKLSDEERKRVHAELKAIVNKENVEKFEEPSDYRKIKSEEVKAFEETISSMIRDLVFEASDIACWVFAKKYVNGWTLEQMIEDMPHAFKFIVAMNTLFEQHMEPTSEEEFKN